MECIVDDSEDLDGNTELLVIYTWSLHPSIPDVGISSVSLKFSG